MCIDLYYNMCTAHTLFLWTDEGKQKRGGICRGDVIYIETFFDTVFIGSPIAACSTCSIINTSEIFHRMCSTRVSPAYIIIR